MGRDETRPDGMPPASPTDDKRLRPYVTPVVGTAPADSRNQRRSEQERAQRGGDRED